MLALLALGSAPLAGCSKTGSDDAAKPPADAAALDPGNYPTAPRTDLGKAGDQGGYVEARRMADFVTMPFQVDPSLTDGYSAGAINGVLKNANSVGMTLRVAIPDSVGNNFVNGYTVQRQSPGTHSIYLQNTVLRYRDPADALAAVNELATKGKKKSGYSGDPDPVTRSYELPGRPESRAITWESSDERHVLAYTAHGPYVLIQETIAPSIEAASNLAVRTLDKQIPSIDKFTPTPADQIADLPSDPTGLLGRTLAPPPDQRTRLVFGLYGPHGFLTISDDPIADEKLFTEAGVTEVVLGGANVYHARDAAGAEQIVTAWSDTRDKTWDPADELPGLAGSRCNQQLTKPGTDDASTLYSCMFAVDDYAVSIFAVQKANLQQKAAAQYLLLTAE